MASEWKQRKLAKEVLGDNLTVEKVAFTFPVDGGGTEVKDVPLAYAPNLIRKVADLIAYHTRYSTIAINIKLKITLC